MKSNLGWDVIIESSLCTWLSDSAIDLSPETEAGCVVQPYGSMKVNANQRSLSMAQCSKGVASWKTCNTRIETVKMVPVLNKSSDAALPNPCIFRQD